MKRILETFSEYEHKALKEAKQQKAKELGKTRLSWHDFLLNIAGVKNGNIRKK